jgi:tRNA threonylcarbamoyladenosine biosynthesis protein TsaE
MNVNYNLDQITEVAQNIMALNLEKIVLFKGEMGAGKTTLIKHICTALGVTSNSSSPTFSIVNEYETASKELIYHFDMYRLKNQQEALDFGFEDYLYSGNYCFIEWPENIADLIPEKCSTIQISIIDSNTRNISVF